MRRFLSAAAAAVLMFSAVGCASGRIHEKSYLRAASVTVGAEKSIVFSFFHEESPVKGTGSDIAQAKSSAELAGGKPIFTGYTELVIVNGGSCGDTLENMLSEWKISPSCMVVCSDSGEQLLREHDAGQLRDIAEQAVKQGIAPECDIITVLGCLSRDGCAETVELRADGSVGSRIIYQF